MSWNFLDLGFLKIAESEVNHSSNHQEFQVPTEPYKAIFGVVFFPLHKLRIHIAWVYRCTGFLYFI